MDKTSSYWVGCTIHEGSFSHVVHARYKKRVPHQYSDNEDELAIKVFPKVKLKAWQIKSIQQEQLLLRGFVLDERKGQQRHYLVQLRASFQDTHNLYLVMECARASLEDLLLEQNSGTLASSTTILTLPFCRRLAIDLWEAIRYLHTQHSVIHCDIKPANVLLRTTTHNKDDESTIQSPNTHHYHSLCLADFGSALDLKDRGGGGSSPSSLHDIVRGTAAYASPELLLLQGGDFTAAIDWWSYACCLYAMLHRGKSPFDLGTEYLSVHRILDYARGHGEFVFPQVPFSDDATAHNEDYIRWEKIITSLLARDPESREDFAVNSARTCLQLIGQSEESGNDDFVVPPTSFRKNPENEEWKDGSLGWVAFV